MFWDQIVSSAVAAVADCLPLRNGHPFFIPFAGIPGGTVGLCGLDEGTRLQRLFRLGRGRRGGINVLFGSGLFLLLPPGSFLGRLLGPGRFGRRGPFRHICPGCKRRSPALLVFLFAALDDG